MKLPLDAHTLIWAADDPAKLKAQVTALAEANIPVDPRAIQKKTVVDQIEIRVGKIQIRFGLLIVEGKTELQRKWHRTAIETNTNINMQMDAVNGHLQQMGYGFIAQDDINRIKQVAGAVGIGVIA